MRTSKPILSYSLRHDPVGSHPTITFSFRYVVQREGDDRPVTCYDTEYSDRSTLEIRFQSNRGEVQPGTIDGPAWYGMRIEMHTTSLADDEVLRAVRRILPKDMDRMHNQVPAILAALDRAKVPHLAYSPALSRWVPASVWSLAQDYRLYYDVGITRTGCTINAFARRGSEDAAITAAVTAALRKSTYCSDQALAAWITGGCKWEAGYYDASHHSAPPSRESLVGRPAPVEAESSAELATAA